DAALLVDGEIPAPVIHTQPTLPSIVEPTRVVIGITGLCNGCEAPQLIAGARVKGACVSGSVSKCDFDVIGAKDNDVFIDERHSSPLHARIDKTSHTKRRIGLSGSCVEREQT